MSQIGTSQHIDLHDWGPGAKWPRGELLQQQVTAIRRLMDQVDGPGAQRGILRRERVGQIVVAGPVGEADRADPRYWLRMQSINTADPDALLTYSDDNDFPGGPVPLILTAINLAESDTNTHLLRPGRRARVWSLKDGGQPDASTDPTVHHFIDVEPPTTFLIKILDADTDDGVYVAAVWDPPTSDPSGPVTEASLGTVGHACKARNMKEVGASGHMLNVSGTFQLIFPATYLCTASDGTLWVTIDAFQVKLCGTSP